jgi:uncharacterized protein (TIGR03905 family)
MKELQYVTQGTCSRLIQVKLDDNHVITECGFVGGCNGNLKGICALVKGKKAEEVIPLIQGISCNGKPTSCPDQLAQALKAALAKEA